MRKTMNAAGSHYPAANNNQLQDYNISPDKKERDIHRSPIKLQRSFPTTLKQLHQWCLAGNDKQPLNPNGYLIDVTNPANYLSFDEAILAASKICAGVGFILTGTNIVIVDIDCCINADNSMSRVAADVLKLLPTYAEVSQSKTGLHLIYIDNDIPAGFTGKKGAIEIYTNKRYVALTGWKLPDSPADLVTLDGLTKRLLDTYFPIADFNSMPDDELLKQHSYPPAQSDDQVLQSLQANQKFQQLYAGNISGYPSQSEADGALMLILAVATALNAPQMRRLFSQSTLGNRDKWTNRKWYQDYLISGAIQFVENKSGDDNMNNEAEYVKFGDYGQHQFKVDQSQYATQSFRQTGFPTIDKYMGFPPGVYCLAAITSAGKTAFSIQLGQQLAQQGENVIYVGYETTPLEVYSRMLARTMKQINPASQFSAQDIRKNLCVNDNYYQLAQQQIHQLPFGFLKVTPKDNVTQLLQKLQHYITNHPGEKPPIIIIDYIQIIPHSGEVKNMLDTNIPKIKHFQQSTGLTFLLISSTNRSSYRSDIGIEAFKESGVIEFSADVIWMLQYTIVNNKKNITPTELEIEKSHNPRRMTLKCLKNRFGVNYEVHFNYYPKFELFSDKDNWSSCNENCFQFSC